MTEASASGSVRFPWILTALMLIALTILIALGTWQVERLAWKQDLLATIEARIGDVPAPVGDIERMVRAGEDIEYRPATATGVFRHGDERFFFATHAGHSGWYVYTPLELAEGQFVFVNRGFVPYDRKDPASRPEGQVAGAVTVAGLARSAPTEKPSSLVPDNDPVGNVFYWKDIIGMSAATGIDPARLMPFFIDADQTANPGGLPAGGVTQITLPNNHLQYAATWYGLAAALLGVYVAILIRRRANRP